MAPAAVNTWALTALLLASPPLTLLSVQVTTNPPSDRAVICAAFWPFAVAVLTRISDPTGAPAAVNSCALTALLLASPVAPPTPKLVSCQTTTKPPFDRAVTWATVWSFSVAVLTRISVPVMVPAAVNTCALIA